MQSDRSADSARLAGSVRGLGVCDVLRVELAICQLPALRAALVDRRAELELEFGVRSTSPAQVDMPPNETHDEDAHARLREEHRLLTRLDASVLGTASEPVVLIGPAGLVLELVSVALRSAVDELAAGLGEGGPHPAAGRAALEAAGAWIVTSLDCRAVEGFSLDPGIDPVHAW